MDEELAELTADLEPSGRPVLPVTEMTYTVQLLQQVVQLLRSQIQQQSPKPIQFPPLPAPKTARQIVAARRRDERRARLLDLVADAQERWAAEHPEEQT